MIFNFQTPLTNHELLEYCRFINFPLNGVLMKDQVRNIPNTYWIVNLQNEDEGGTHWCALNITSKKKVYWFDSYGIVAPETVIKLLNVKNEDFSFNDIRIQSMKSIFCGYFALCFLIFMRHYSKKPDDGIENFLELFHLKLFNKNDTIIKNKFLDL
jgi:hypothetical protein